MSDQPGRSFVVGASASKHLWLARLDARGLPVWERDLSRDPLRVFYEHAAVSARGADVFVAASTRTGTSRSPLMVAKVSDTGALLWSQTLVGRSSPNVSGPVFFTFDSEGYQPRVLATVDGGAYVTFTADWGTFFVIQAVRFDAAGSIVWTKWLGLAQPTHVSNVYDSVVTSDDGLLMVVNDKESSGPPVLCKLDSAGVIQFSARYTPTGVSYSLPRGLDVTSDGGAIVVGGSRTQDLFWAFRIDATGSILWSKRWQDSSGPLRFTVAKVASTSANGCVVVGEVLDTGTSNRDLWIAQLDPQGVPRWSRRLGGLGIEQGLAIDRLPGRDEFHVAGITSGSFGLSGGWVLSVPASGLLAFDPLSAATSRFAPLSLIDTPMVVQSPGATDWVDPSLAQTQSETFLLVPAVSVSESQTL